MLNPIRCRPMHDLLAALPTLPAAEDCMRLAQSGLRGIGTLLVHAAPETEAGSIGGEVVEAIGHLLSELGALAGHCPILAAACRTQLAAREASGSTATARARRKKRLPSTV